MKYTSVHKGFARKMSFIILIIVLFFWGYLPSVNGASDCFFCNPFSSDDAGTVAERLSNALLLLVLPFLTVFIVVLGFMFVTAQGNEQKLRQLKGALFWTVIGTVIILGAATIVGIARDLAGRI